MTQERLTPGSGFPVVTLVRDAIYDQILLSEPELALLSTSAFLRLDRIQQLGFVSRVWPGARHARYDHSLGVMHLTRLAIDHLRATDAGDWITDEDARVYSAAALLHDIGHYPFSHAIEELGPPVLSHETVGARIIEQGAVADILRHQWQIDPARVSEVIAPRRSAGEISHHPLRGLLSGTLDMDKLDYLPRDAHACNVPYGGVDTDRLIESLRLGPANGQSGALGVMIGAKGIGPLHSLINARQAMFDNVYWHHTNRACMAMLLRAVQESLLSGATSAEDLTGHDDASLLAALAGEDMPEVTRRLTAALRERRVHKRVVEISGRATELYGRIGNLYFDPLARRNVEDRLASDLGQLIGKPVRPGSILIDIPKPEKWRTEIRVQFDDPPLGFSGTMPWRDVVGSTDEDFKRYEEHRRLVRIVAEEPVRNEMREHWERLLYPLLGGVV